MKHQRKGTYLLNELILLTWFKTNFAVLLKKQKTRSFGSGFL